MSALRMTKAKLGVLVVTAGLVLYLVFTAQRGWIMLTDDSLIAKALGLALFALPVIGAWALFRELLFGTRTEQLAGILESEGGLPPDTLPRTPGGRIVREAADAEFEKYRAEAEAAPEDWRSWFRLSCAYDASGDRKNARATMRRAIRMHREPPAAA
ncbi:tetratricopeptide repeat protein [Brevibacterium album]|uniref:tetratricopeptide repeat protein n=1 Tax=Brevibacterium album TaxID=417948 RepID=UPI000552886E|nr:tetratricopeptide repeat protein [Brevibacterium album]